MGYRERRRAAVGLASACLTAVMIAACSRGPNPPVPTEDLTATIIGVVQETRKDVPVELDDGTTFPPDLDAPVRRVRNWPAWSEFEREDIEEGALLLAGPDADGGWWYELVDFFGPSEEGCWFLHGGSFDEGETIRFSSGLRVPKASAFEIRQHGHMDVQAFPGHQDDRICINRAGEAVYFDLFVGR